MIVALDEFEEIEKKLTAGIISEDLLAFLRSTMQHRTGISLIFAGTHTLNEMASERWSSYFRSALPVRVSYLDEASARRLITNPIPDFPLDYEAEAVDLLIAETRCHPCLIQLTCSALVDLKNKRLLEDKAAGRRATVQDARQALAEALKTGDLVFSSIWQWVPKRAAVVGLNRFGGRSELGGVGQDAAAFSSRNARDGRTIDRSRSSDT